MIFWHGCRAMQPPYKRREETGGEGGSTKMLVVFSCFWWTGTLKYSDVQNDNYVRDEKIAETDGEERGRGSKDDVTPADRSGNADDILSCIIERVKKEKKLPTFFLFSKATKEQRRRRRRFPVGGSKATNTSHTCKRAGKSPCIDVFFKRKRKEENSKERIGGGRFAPIDRLPLCGFFARGPISRLPKSRERPKSVSTVDWETWAECRRIIRDLFLVFTRISGLFSFEIAGGQVGGFQERHTRNEKKKMRALTSSLANDSIPKQKTRNWVANATERSIWTYFFLFFFQTSPSPNFENLKYSKTRNRNPTQTFCTDRNQTLFMFLKKNLTCVKFA